MTKEKMRGVFERPPGSGIWWISYFASGIHHREKVGRRSVAVETYVNRKREIREGRFVAPQRVAKETFGALAEKAIAYRLTRLRPKSCADDVGRLERLSELHKLPAVEMTAGIIETALENLQKNLHAVPRKGRTPAERLSGATLNAYRNFISSVFRYAIRHGIMADDPVKKVPRFKENEGRDRFLDQDEERALRKTIRESDFPERELSIDLAINTGMRLNEQNSLTWADVSLERGEIKVSQGKTGRRYIPINQTARAALETLYKESKGRALVSPGWSESWWTRCQRVSGILNFTWHDLRHTFASRLVMAGVDLSTVQKYLGHKSILTTQRYAHLAPKHLMAGINRLDPKKKKATSTRTSTGEIREIARAAKA